MSKFVRLMKINSIFLSRFNLVFNFLKFFIYKSNILFDIKVNSKNIYYFKDKEKIKQ